MKTLNINKNRDKKTVEIYHPGAAARAALLEAVSVLDVDLYTFVYVLNLIGGVW